MQFHGGWSRAEPNRAGACGRGGQRGSGERERGSEGMTKRSRIRGTSGQEWKKKFNAHMSAIGMLRQLDPVQASASFASPLCKTRVARRMREDRVGCCGKTRRRRRRRICKRADVTGQGVLQVVLFNICSYVVEFRRDGTPSEGMGDRFVVPPSPLHPPSSFLLFSLLLLCSFLPWSFDLRPVLLPPSPPTGLRRAQMAFDY